MGKVVRCSIVIYDDFNNVLIAERGKKADKIWGLFGKEMKGKEKEDKCICKAIDKELKCTIFDLEPFKEYKLGETEETLKVFKGTVKEYMTCHRNINCIKWINKKEVSNYKFNDEDMKILEDFFNN